MEKETPKRKIYPPTGFDFSIPFPSPSLLTPGTNSNPHTPFPFPTLSHNERLLPGIYDPYSRSSDLQQMSQYYSSSEAGPSSGYKTSPPDYMGPPLPLAHTIPPPPQQYAAPPPLISTNSYPPPTIYYAQEQPHLYPPPLEHDRSRPPMALNLPHRPTFDERDYSQHMLSYAPAAQPQYTYAPGQSPYGTPGEMIYHNTTPGEVIYHNTTPGAPDSGGSGHMTEYFPPFHGNPHANAPHPGDMANLGGHSAYNLGPPLISQTYPAPPPHRASLVPVTSTPVFPPARSSASAAIAAAGPSTHRPRGGHTSKTSRQQFSACGACRHRRVKCDLKEKQDALELMAAQEGKKGAGPIRGKGKNRRLAVCTNCEERGVDCVDEYAPIKAAKQLRRGKRISEIETIYGRQAASAAAVAATLVEEGPLPELTAAFFDSPFFRRFQVQRPVLDSRDFTQRYLSHSRPSAAAMGPEGAILCHVLYAWALSYGVDANGELDVPEGGLEPLGPLPLDNASDNELLRELDRQRRFSNMREAVEVVLKEIDECGVMRKPTWDGVRVLLLILPLTEGISTSVERLAMYETALNQVYSLCSFAGMGYDGQPAATSGVNGGSDGDDDEVAGTGQNVQMIRVRIYWYAFVHEGITTGLKGGRLLLDDEDLDTMQDSIHNRAVVLQNSSIKTSVKFATAPINLALACRLINRALTGPSARRAKSVNGTWVKEAWEALERSWEEFEALKYAPDASSIYSTMDEVMRFADGWKIFLFEAQNVIRKILEERYSKLLAARESAFISDPSSEGVSPGFDQERMSELVNLQRLLDISRAKCEVQCRQILDMVRVHVGSRFFEWDASLVRDGTFYAAKLLPRMGGGEEDIAVCLQALNELRWAHAKAPDRSAELRQEWADSRQDVSPPVDLSSWTTPGYHPVQPPHSAPLPMPHNVSYVSYDSNHSLNNSLSGSSGSPYSPGQHRASQGYIPVHDLQQPQPQYQPHPTQAQPGAGHGYFDPNSIPRGGSAGYDMTRAQWTNVEQGMGMGMGVGMGAGQGAEMDLVKTEWMGGMDQGYPVYGHELGPPPLGDPRGGGMIGGVRGYEGGAPGFEGYRGPPGT